jgi:UPF0271 protein
MFDWTLEESGSGPVQIARRVVGLLQQGAVPALDGGEARIDAETICVHSDTPGAGQIVQAIRQALSEATVSVKAPA